MATNHRIPLDRVRNIGISVHQAGAVTMFVGLFLLFSRIIPPAQLDPILAFASNAVLLGALLMLLMVLK